MISAKNVEQATGLVILALIGIGTFLVLKPFLSAIVWAAVLSYSTWPFFVRIKHHVGERKALAAAAMIFLGDLLCSSPYRRSCGEYGGRDGSTDSDCAWLV